MTPVVLSTLNATYQHCAFGLRYLYANLGEVQREAEIVEFTISQNARDIAESILARKPRIVGFGVYIWNTRETEKIVSLLKKVSPETVIVLGGPEVSYEPEGQSLTRLADYVVRGEADHLFGDLCRRLLQGDRPPNRILSGPLPEIGRVNLPYRYYNEEDIRNRVLYVEASRGCPYKCEFCLSALDVSVRNFPLENFLAEMEMLLLRGARQFKFVDRTFNLNPIIGRRILDFFLAHIDKGLFLHFEMVPDRLPTELKESIAKFPAGALQFEIGIQTLNTVVEGNISRRQDHQKTRDNLVFLRKATAVHLHADLIVGLPGETFESFGKGFDELFAMRPHEIQVGVLKRLKGTPITRYDSTLLYEEGPPFAIVKTDAMGFSEIQGLVRFAKFWDLIANRGNFPHTVAHLTELGEKRGSVFAEFYELSDFLNRRHPERHSIALGNLAESLWRYLVEVRQVSDHRATDLIQKDYCDGITKREAPKFLKAPKPTPRRQQRHLQVN